jgi:hypothetical protein
MRSTLPRLPRSFPERTSTWSFFRICSRFGTATAPLARGTRSS